MLWGKLVNGELQYAPPEIYCEDGRVIDLVSDDDFRYEGYKRVIRKRPPYNPYTEYLVFKEYIEDDDIYIIYEVKGREDDLNKVIEEEINKE